MPASSSISAAPPRPSGRQVWAWAMYDWGNSAYATTVVAGFFPVFFKDFWSVGVAPEQSTFVLGLTVSLASLTVAILAPVMGALVDQGAHRKQLLALFAGFAILLTAGLIVIPQGGWRGAALCYGASYVAWLLSLVIYDSMILLVTRHDTVDRVSGLGFALGYLGGGLLFTVNVLMTLKPSWFGLLAADNDDPALLAAAQARAVKLSFVTVAVWWAVFSIPLLLLVKEPRGTRAPSFVQAVRRGFAQLADSFRHVRGYRYAFAFLLAYWLYIDGVDTVITMAVDYGKSLGFATSDLISALLLVQFVAFPFAWLFGWLGGRIGPKPMILAGLVVYMFVTMLATQLSLQPFVIGGVKISQFHLLAFLVGTAQGGVQALSRSLFTRLIPPAVAGEFFGFYNLVGRFAAILGPMLMGGVTWMTGSPRLGIAAVGLLLIVGGGLLVRLDVRAGAAEIAAMGSS